MKTWTLHEADCRVAMAAMDADSVIMLYRPAVCAEEGSAAARDQKTLEAIVRKQRDGALGTVRLRFDGARVRITRA